MVTPFKATHSIDLPTGEEFVCDKHANIFKKKNSFMGFGFDPQKLPAKAHAKSCIDCLTEAKAKKR